MTEKSKIEATTLSINYNDKDMITLSFSVPKDIGIGPLKEIVRAFKSLYRLSTRSYWLSLKSMFKPATQEEIKEAVINILKEAE